MKKRTIAQTLAPAKDIIKGSDINKKNSATKQASSTIELSERIVKVLQDKLKAFEEKHPNNTTITLNDLKAVYRRGSGAYSTSHRPNITRAGWSYARVNKFLEKAAGNKVKEAYIQDDDLLKYKQGGKVLNKADKMGKQIICKNCGWKWNTDKSDEHNKYICNKCNFDNRTFYDSDPIGYANGGLIAPNGKPSNLTPEQYKLVRTPAFKRWFGDWENDPKNASKVIDANGEPLVCYHGSYRKFNIFEEKYIGTSNDAGFYGKGFYFTFQKEGKNFKFALNEAAYYGGEISSCFIKSIHPFDFSVLSDYKGYHINYLGAESIVFLYNLAKMQPSLGKIIKIDKNIYNSSKNRYDTEEVAISILPKLIEKYSKELKTYVTNNNWGERVIKSGYVKSEIVNYDYTSTGGTKGFYESQDQLGKIEFRVKDGIQYPSDEEIELLLICDAIKKYDGISPEYQPEGYMTRYPQITEVIKEKHDCILQGETGDELVVFNSNQIKLADGTNTTFDPNNPDIRYKQGGKVKTYWYKGLFNKR